MENKEKLVIGSVAGGGIRHKEIKMKKIDRGAGVRREERGGEEDVIRKWVKECKYDKEEGGKGV